MYFDCFYIRELRRYWRTGGWYFEGVRCPHRQQRHGTFPQNPAWRTRVSSSLLFSSLLFSSLLFSSLLFSSLLFSSTIFNDCFTSESHAFGYTLKRIPYWPLLRTLLSGYTSLPLLSSPHPPLPLSPSYSPSLSTPSPPLVSPSPSPLPLPSLSPPSPLPLPSLTISLGYRCHGLQCPRNPLRPSRIRIQHGTPPLLSPRSHR